MLERNNYMTKSSRIVVGFWRRFFADFLDALILGIPGFGIGYAFRYTFSAMGTHAIWFGLACGFLYYGVQHTYLAGGQTPGKRLLGIQVLRRDGEYLSFSKSFLRYLVISFVFYNGIFGGLLNYLPLKAMMAAGSIYFIIVIWAFFACFLMIPFHPLKRGLHDIAADSIVVYKGTYDDAIVNQLDDSVKAKRAMLILTVVSVIFAGACIIWLSKFTSSRSIDFTKLTEIHQFLRTEYNVQAVRANTFNGEATSLVIAVHVPLATFENDTEKEHLRQEVYNKTTHQFNNLEKFGPLNVVITSGFNIGIANFQTSD